MKINKLKKIILFLNLCLLIVTGFLIVRKIRYVANDKKIIISDLSQFKGENIEFIDKNTIKTKKDDSFIYMVGINQRVGKIEVYIDSTDDKNFSIQYYPDMGEGFNEYKSVKKEADLGKNSARIGNSVLYNLRIDFGSSANKTYKISKIILNPSVVNKYKVFSYLFIGLTLILCLGFSLYFKGILGFYYYLYICAVMYMGTRYYLYSNEESLMWLFILFEILSICLGSIFFRNLSKNLEG